MPRIHPPVLLFVDLILTCDREPFDLVHALLLVSFAPSSGIDVCVRMRGKSFLMFCITLFACVPMWNSDSDFNHDLVKFLRIFVSG